MGYSGNANKDSLECIFDVPQVRIVFSHIENSQSSPNAQHTRLRIWSIAQLI